MTLRQLHTFATVARLGSNQAASRELGISEPAVSAAVGVLRREFGDDLYARHGRALVLTRAGERLALLAAEITDLADRARQTVEESAATARVVHVAVTATVEEHVAAPLLAAFTDRAPDVEAVVEVQPADRFAELLHHRRADVTLGPRPAGDAGHDLVSVAFLRYQLVVVAGPAHPLVGAGALAAAALEREPWLVGPRGVEDGSPTQRYLARCALAPADVRAFPSEAAALSAAAAGEGVMLTLTHAALDPLRRGALARLDVRGTPIDERWHASTLPEGHCLTAALALRRFAVSRDAVHAIAAPRRGVPVARVRPPVHATLWASRGRG